jgi:hypothetical protein
MDYTVCVTYSSLMTIMYYMKIFCHYPVPETISSLQFQVVAILATWANFGSTAWKVIASNSVHQHTYIPIASSDIKSLACTKFDYMN